MMKLFLILSWAISFKVLSFEIPKSFYTDDSKYYLQLTKNGFKQRFRLHKNHCHDLVSAEIILKNIGSTKKFQKIASLKSKSTWPKIYKLNEPDYCWYEVEVNGLDLNVPQSNQYVIRLSNGKRYSYFQGFTDSILPSNRFSPVVTSWIQRGAHGVSSVEGGGHFFKLWEPTAQEVHLFINKTKKYKMKRDGSLRSQKSYVLYLPKTADGHEYHYQFIKNGQYESLVVANNKYTSPVKIDPMALELTYDSKGGQYNGYINPRGVIKTKESFPWRHDHKSIKPEKKGEPLIIYQLWPFAFNPQKVNGKYEPGKLSDIIKKRNYLSDLGINTIELLPIHETRFHASWGYALDSLLLIENNYGSRQDLMKLVDSFHEKGIKLFLDVVINHVNNDLLREPLSPTNQRTKFYDGNTGWGPKPRFSSIMVQKWIMDSLLSLQRDFHIDGYRFDMIEYVYRNSATGYKFLQELNTLLKNENKNFHLSAEQLPDNVWVTFPIKDGGLGFDSQWNDKFKNFFELEFDHYRSNNRNFKMAPLTAALLGYSDQHINGEEHFGPPLRTVNYLGSHDFIANRDPMLRIISDFESYEWVDHLHFYRVRPLQEANNKHRNFRLIHNNFTHSFLKLAYGVLFTKPGSLLFFQGEELAQDLNLENEWSYLSPIEGNTTPSKNVDLERYVTSHRLPWEYLNPDQESELSFLTPSEHKLFTGYTRYIKDLIHFKKKYPKINLENAKNIKTYGHNDVITYEIGGGDNHFFVVANFKDSKKNFWINFPGQGEVWWQEILNSSGKKYGPQSNRYLNIISNVGGRFNNIRAYGPSLIIFKKVDKGLLNIPLYFRSNMDNWQLKSKNKLTQAEQTGNLYAVELDIKTNMSIEFKLATADWEIELGSAIDPKFLTYVPDQDNIKKKLKKGHYKFIFNINTFSYQFIKTR